MAFESTSESEPTQSAAASNGSRWVFLLAFAVFASLMFIGIYSRFFGPAEQMGGEHPGVGATLSVLNVEPFIEADQAVTVADLKGKVTLINFWGPWCPPCRIEMPHLAEIERKYRTQDQFKLLSVACGTWVYPSLDAMKAETTKYRDQAKLEFPIYFDPDFKTRTGLESDIGKEPQTMGYPTTVLIDQQGRVAGVWEGYASNVPAQIESSIERLIAK
jgi:thiol-disulfide isomerase/thioredoxin